MFADILAWLIFKYMYLIQKLLKLLTYSMKLSNVHFMFKNFWIIYLRITWVTFETILVLFSHWYVTLFVQNKLLFFNKSNKVFGAELTISFLKEPAQELLKRFFLVLRCPQKQFLKYTKQGKWRRHVSSILMNITKLLYVMYTSDCYLY